MATATASSLDAYLSDLLSSWSTTTTLLALTIAAVLLVPIFLASEPDTHPLLLARQSSISPVRNRGESAIYRSPEVPHGYPLKTGLNVKEAGAPRWASGKDGDLRDVWREVQRGGREVEVSGLHGGEKKMVPSGLIMSVYGKEEVVERSVEEMSREISVVGRELRSKGVKRVAILLPNNIEYLQTIFACTFYNLTPILLPYTLPPSSTVYDLLRTTQADALVCAAGTLPLEDVARECKDLRALIWVVEKTSRHMDWTGIPDSAQGRLSVSVWHDVVEENKETASAELPNNQAGEVLGEVVTVWQSSTEADANSKSEIVTFSHANLVSATAALISALPLRQRLTPSDLFLPATHFSDLYCLLQTFAALFQHSSVAIASVAQPGVDLSVATRSISPTVIAASSETMANLHRKETEGVVSLAQKVGKYSHAQAQQAGRMGTDSLLFKVLAPSSSGAEHNKPGKLRLILTDERLGTGTPPLSSTMLSDLRIFTRARICYALCAAKVAGAVSQTHVFDYRREDGRERSHFGIPLSSVEVRLKNKDDGKVADVGPEGEIVVAGPAVSGKGDFDLGVRGRFREDGTLVLS